MHVVQLAWTLHVSVHIWFTAVHGAEPLLAPHACCSPHQRQPSVLMHWLHGDGAVRALAKHDSDRWHGANSGSATVRPAPIVMHVALAAHHMQVCAAVLRSHSGWVSITAQTLHRTLAASGRPLTPRVVPTLG